MWFGGRERNKLLEQIKERRIKQGKSCVANTKDKRVSESKVLSTKNFGICPSYNPLDPFIFDSLSCNLFN